MVSSPQAWLATVLVVVDLLLEGLLRGGVAELLGEFLMGGVVEILEGFLRGSVVEILEGFLGYSVILGGLLRDSVVNRESFLAYTGDTGELGRRSLDAWWWLWLYIAN